MQMKEKSEGHLWWDLVRPAVITWEQIASHLGKNCTGSQVRKWLKGYRPTFSSYPGGKEAVFARLLEMEQPCEAKRLLEQIVRGEPPGTGQQKRPGNSEGITRPLHDQDSSQNQVSPSACRQMPVVESASDLPGSATAALKSAEELLKRGSEFCDFPAAERLARTVAQKGWGCPGGRVILQAEDLDGLIVPEDLALVDTLAALRHLVRAMPKAVDAVRKHLGCELHSFLNWLLARSSSVLWDAREAIRSGHLWLEDSANWLRESVTLSSAWSESGKRPSDEPYLWNALCLLESHSEWVKESIPAVETHLKLHEALVVELKPLFDDWAACYQQLKPAEEFDSKDFIRDDPRGIRTVLSDPDDLQDWADSLEWRYWEPPNDLDESFRKPDPDWMPTPEYAARKLEDSPF